MEQSKQIRTATRHAVEAAPRTPIKDTPASAICKCFVLSVIWEADTTESQSNKNTEIVFFWCGISTIHKQCLLSVNAHAYSAGFVRFTLSDDCLSVFVLVNPSQTI